MVGSVAMGKEETILKIKHLDDSVFAAKPKDWKAMDVRSATDILERLKTAMPGIFASGHNVATTSVSNRTKVRERSER